MLEANNKRSKLIVPPNSPTGVWLRRGLSVALAVLGCKIWLSIVFEYRWYFPPNFEEATFLIGRRESFAGVYRIAFYTHIVASPIAILLATGLFLSAANAQRLTENWFGRSFLSVFSRSSDSVSFWAVHRLLGKIEIVLVVLLVAPSGLVMAWGTLFGPVAALGFAAHSLATFGSGLATIYYARARKIAVHQFWATACWLLLCGPLVFRLTAGLSIVAGWESPTIYQLNAWTSWLVPLLVWLSWRWNKSPHLC
jgi:Predicted membrane protein (DUF2306)